MKNDCYYNEITLQKRELQKGHIGILFKGSLTIVDGRSSII
jgi:hypothetical protein